MFFRLFLLKTSFIDSKKAVKIENINQIITYLLHHFLFPAPISVSMEIQYNLPVNLSRLDLNVVSAFIH